MNVATLSRPVSSSNSGLAPSRSASAIIALPISSSETPEESSTPTKDSLSCVVSTPLGSILSRRTRQCFGIVSGAAVGAALGRAAPAL